jgi:DNA gyrase/topoisomerase IV subunit B
VTELETINTTEHKEEERMIDKIFLWNEISNPENTIFYNTLCSKRGELHKQNVDGQLLPTEVNVLSTEHFKRKKKKKEEKEEEEVVERGRRRENSNDIWSV